MNREMQKLVDAPLADPLKLFLPKGTRTVKRAPKAEYYNGVDAPKIARSEIERRKADAASAKLVSVLDCYATTSVPFERIAEHTKLTLEEATAAMLRRGRSSMTTIDTMMALIAVEAAAGLTAIAGAMVYRSRWAHELKGIELYRDAFIGASNAAIDAEDRLRKIERTRHNSAKHARSVQLERQRAAVASTTAKLNREIAATTDRVAA